MTTSKKSLAALDKYHAGCDALASGFLDEAIVAFTDAISYDSNNALYYVRRSQTYSMKHRGGGGSRNESATAAVDDAGKALKADPTNPECYVRRGECALVHEGDLEGCKKVISRAKERGATSKSGSKTPFVPFVLLEAEVAIIDRDFKQVKELSQQVMAQTSNPEESIKASKYLKLANMKLSGGGGGGGGGGGTTTTTTAGGKAQENKTSSAAPADEGADLDKHEPTDFISCLIASGQECFSSGAIQQAINHWNNALLLSTAIDNPSQNKLVRTKLAAAYRAIGRADLSGEMIGGQHAGNATNAAAYMDKGNTQFASKNYEAALANFKQAARLDEEIGNQAGYATAWNNIACVYYALKKYNEAIEFFEKQKNLAEQERDIPRLVGSAADIAECYLHLGQSNAAHQSLGDALALQEELYAVTILENDKNIQSGGGGGDQGLVDSYVSTMQRCYSIAISLYLKVGKADIALEWMERSKSLSFFSDSLSSTTPPAELDVDIEDIKAKAAATKSAVLSFYIGGTSAGIVDGVLLTPNGRTEHRQISIEVLRIINPGALVSEQKTMLEDLENSLGSSMLNGSSNLNASVMNVGGAGGAPGEGAPNQSDPAIRRFRSQYHNLIHPFFNALQTAMQDGLNNLVIIPHGALFGVAWNSLVFNKAASSKLEQLADARHFNQLSLGTVFSVAVACSGASWVYCSGGGKDGSTTTSTTTAGAVQSSGVSIINDASLPLEPNVSSAKDPIEKGGVSSIQLLERSGKESLSEVFKKVDPSNKIVHLRTRISLKKLLAKSGASNVKILGSPAVVPKSNRRERDVSITCVASDSLIGKAAHLSGNTLLAAQVSGASKSSSSDSSASFLTTARAPAGWLFVGENPSDQAYPNQKVAEVLPECAVSLASSYPAAAAAGPNSSDSLTNYTFSEGSIVVLEPYAHGDDFAASRVDHIRALRAAGAAVVLAPVCTAVENSVRQEYLEYLYRHLGTTSPRGTEEGDLVSFVSHAIQQANQAFVSGSPERTQATACIALTDWAGYSVFV